MKFDRRSLFAVDRPSLLAGVRITTSALVPLIGGQLLGQSPLALLVAMGELNVATSDTGGFFRLQILSLLATTVGITVAAFLGTLAGLSAAETLRAEGFSGHLTLISDEPYLPYDRPPLSKAVLTGWIAAEHTQLPRFETLADVEWRLGVAATGLDPWQKQVRLADGHSVAYDRLLIASGTRARPWFNQAEAELDGVFTLRGRDDAQLLRQRLAAKPRRVLVPLRAAMTAGA